MESLPCSENRCGLRKNGDPPAPHLGRALVPRCLAVAVLRTRLSLLVHQLNRDAQFVLLLLTISFTAPEFTLDKIEVWYTAAVHITAPQGATTLGEASALRSASRNVKRTGGYGRRHSD